MSISFGLPVPAKIVAVEIDNYRTKTFTLEASVTASPGQFAMVWLPGFDEKPFSLVNDSPLTLMITQVGPFTRLIHEMEPGDRLWLRGPFGHGFSSSGEHHHVLLVGGGYGVAPLLWLARQQLDEGAEVTTVIGARTESDLLYAERFRELGNAHPFGLRHELLVATDDGSSGHRGLVTDIARGVLTGGSVDSIFACGPHAMLVALRGLSKESEVPCQLSWEAYMRCGMGICGSCEFEGAVLCLDGPVLSS